MDNNTKRTWAKISLENIKHNYYQIRKAIPQNCKFLGVVKANAYGHGAVEVAKTLESVGADYLAVACLDEAIELRKNNIKLPILILGHTPSEYTDKLIEYNICQCVANLNKAKEYSLEASKLNKNLKVHIKLDTGMSRLGFLCAGSYFENGIKNLVEACSLPNLSLEGIFTHFSVSDEFINDDEEYTRNQYKLFNDVIDTLVSKGITFKIRHCANSGVVINYPEFTMDMVRPGLLLYGYGDNGKLGLKPCMSVYTRVSTIKYVDPGVAISYGRHYLTDSRQTIGVISMGYADGLFRSLSNKCEFDFNGHKVKQVGNICMDMCMINITGLDDCDINSVIEIFGENNSLEELASKGGTIPYELMCSMSSRVKRIY